MIENHIDYLIQQWGLWSRQDGTGRLDATMSCFAGLIPSEPNESPMINDDQAMAIDSAILALKIFLPKSYKVIMMRYYYNAPTDVIVKKLKIGRHKVRDLQNSGESFILGALIKKQKTCNLESNELY